MNCVPGPLTPAKTAWMDQERAAQDILLDGWVTRLRTQVADHGRDQGTADIALALAMSDAGWRDNLLLVALLRLAFPDPPAARQPPELYDGPPQ